MTLDNENQRKMLLQLISAVQFSGAALDEAYTLKQAIMQAEVKEKDSKASS